MTTEKADKSRHTVWLSDVAWNAVKRHYREDNCSAHNEYIEKAIRSTQATWTPKMPTPISPASSPMSWRANWIRWAVGWDGCCSSWR